MGRDWEEKTDAMKKEKESNKNYRREKKAKFSI
jgi:hypothetical protein